MCEKNTANGVESRYIAEQEGDTSFFTKYAISHFRKTGFY